MDDHTTKGEELIWDYKGAVLKLRENQKSDVCAQLHIFAQLSVLIFSVYPCESHPKVK